MAALVTWLTLLSISLYTLTVHYQADNQKLVLLLVLMLTFMGSFLCSTSDRFKSKDRRRKLHLLLQITVVFVLYFTAPLNYLPILATIWCAQLPRTFSFGSCVIIAGVICLPVFYSVGFYWQTGSGLVSAMVYWMFNVFAIVTMDRAFKEEQAKEKANELNRELLATQSLLTEATRQSERLRISRNIHDVVGHHLTALTINLQVASHLTQGKAKQTVEQCHSVAKLLLVDVREAVSEIRDKSEINVPGALQTLIDNVPSLAVELQFDEQLQINEVLVAEVIVRVVQEALTNALKHGQAEHCWISVQCEGDNALRLLVKSDGCIDSDITPGNGLTGMQERVAQLHGAFSYQAKPPFFQISVRCPISL